MNRLVLTGLVFACLTAFSPAQEQAEPAAESRTIDESSARLEIYDVSDIVLFGTQGDAASAFNKKEAMKRNIRLAETMRTYLRPSLGEGLHEVKPLGNGTIVVTGTSEQHAWVREFIEMQRAGRDTFVLLEVEFFKAPFDLAKKLTNDEGPQFFNVKVAAEKKRIVDEIKAVDGVEFFTRNLVAYPHTDCTLSLIKKISYVSGFTVHEDVEPMKNRLVCPVVQTVDDGIKLDARVTLLTENRFGVELSFTDTEVIEIKPIRTEQGTFGMPTIAQTSGNGTSILTEGSTVFLTAQFRDAVSDGHIGYQGKMALITLKKVFTSK